MKKKLLWCILITLFFSPTIIRGEENSNIGVVQIFSGSSLPSGYMLADGSAISRTTYSELFHLIGVTYGAGDGSTTFNLPNFSGRVPIGKSNESEFNTLGKKGGEKAHVLTVDELPSHTHTFTGYGHTHSYTDSPSTSDENTNTPTATFTGSAATSSSAGSHSHQTRWRYIAPSAYGSAGGSNPFLKTGTAASTTSTNAQGNHTHTLTASGTVTINNAAHTHNSTVSGSLESASSNGVNQNTGKGSAHSNLQPYIAMKYIIKVR